MREVRVFAPHASSVSLNYVIIPHHLIMNMEFLAALRAVSYARKDAKIVKFKMRVASTVSRNFCWRDKENRSSKVQVVFSNFHGC